MDADKIFEQIKNGKRIISNNTDEYFYDKDKNKFCIISYVDEDLISFDKQYFNEDEFRRFLDCNSYRIL